MIVSVYLNKWVKIDTSNNFYYHGLIIDSDSDSVVLRDKNNRLVTLKIFDIVNIREVSQ